VQVPGLVTGVLHVLGSSSKGSSSSSSSTAEERARATFTALFARVPHPWLLPRLDDLTTSLLAQLRSQTAGAAATAAWALGVLAREPSYARRLVTVHAGFKGWAEVLQTGAPAVAQEALSTLCTLAASTSRIVRPNCIGYNEPTTSLSAMV
jgi:hypothetical protein